MSDNAELIFSLPPSATGELVFGEVEGLPPDVIVTLDATFAAPVFSAVVGPKVKASVDVTFGAMTAQAQVDYSVNVARPLVAVAVSPVQQGARVAAELAASSPGFAPLRPAGEVGAESAAPMRAGRDLRLPYRLTRSRPSVGVPTRDAQRLPGAACTQGHQTMLVYRTAVAQAHSLADRRSLRLHTSHQERLRDRRPVLASRRPGTIHATLQGAWGHAQGMRRTSGSTARQQEAMRPGPGVRAPVMPPVGEVCYIPDPALLFAESVAASPALLFRCGEHDNPTGPSTVIVPIRRTYMVLNNVSLRRVTGDILLPALSMSLSIDHESWTYGFSASLPADAEPYLQPETDGSPALLRATINGASFLLIAESISRDRSFSQRTISLRGRGKNAVLDSPYAPIMQFGSDSDRTVQQLMQHVLTLNGVSLGWGVDFGITDWLVPGGTWTSQGSYMAALTDIAGAAGAYLQPHPTADTLRLLPLYPSAPWDWGTQTPDIVLPSSVPVQEGVEWLSKPAYNAVVVTGTTAGGVRCNVSRSGTAGDVSAPMVTHALITQPTAGAQRGRAVLSDTGRQARLNLRLPVLSETGIIMPGKFVSYTDGPDTRFGITRGVDVQVGRDAVWQNITLETHP